MFFNENDVLWSQHGAILRSKALMMDHFVFKELHGGICGLKLVHVGSLWGDLGLSWGTLGLTWGHLGVP